MKRVLVTGGAGFIGSHLIDSLLARGCEVMAFDNLHKQVHPLSPQWPAYTVTDADGKESPWIEQEGLSPWFGDVRDVSAVLSALINFKPDAVIHLAALVGVGQSNEKIVTYTSANVTGTAMLMNCICDYNSLVDDRAQAVALLAEKIEIVPQVKAGEVEIVNGEEVSIMETQEEAEARYEEWRAATEEQMLQLPDEKCLRVFIAGSMSAYGEGRYLCGNDGNASHYRDIPSWCDEMDSKPLPPFKDGRGGAIPAGLQESDALRPTSVYASNKAEQERLSLIIGKTRGLDVRVGRFFNAYGTRQALSNPYTGVGAIFASRANSGLAPRVYEDGKQSRDFIHVSDLCSGIEAIMDSGEAGEVYNIGTGVATSIGWLAERISAHFDAPAPEITGQVRVGDIRHAFADASKLQALGWMAKIPPADGVRLLCEWADNQGVESTDDLDAAHNDLLQAGLLSGGSE